MMDKETALRELNRVKFVLGNGFDLFCGLKTRYLDFFDYWGEKYKYLDEWIGKVTSLIDQNPNLESDPQDAYLPLEHGEKINCWDVFFALHHNQRGDYLWSDIESMMLKSLKDESDANYHRFDVRWRDVYDYIKGAPFSQDRFGSFIMASYILNKSEKVPESPESFYEYVLAQLKIFEGIFGRYITKQHIACSPFVRKFNERYINNARSVLTSLCNPEQIVGIDCFNYGFTPETRFWDRCKFVNGDCLNPIFGIDSVFGPDDPRYIFTKTYRRIEWDMNLEMTAGTNEFDNVIVFGHSLNSHDYSYFFPMLDQLEMMNFVSKKKLIIAYSIYDPSKEVEIKKTLRKSIYALFQAYADYCGRGENSSRLLDSLTTQGRVITHHIEAAPQYGYDFQKSNTDYLFYNSPDNVVEQYWEAYLCRGREIKIV